MMLRHATMDDADDLFRWRNDPLTQASFKSTAPVTWSQHGEWMWRNVRYGGVDHIVLIGITDKGEKAGVLRFDNKSDLEYDVSLCVAPEHRGHGYAAELLYAGCQGMMDYALNAEIRRDNMASQNAFTLCGFHLVESNNNFRKFRRGAR